MKTRMSILITGIHGFVGTHLSALLRDEYRVYGFDKEATSRHYDAIIHLAGKAHDTANRSAAEEYFAANTELTRKIFDFFLESAATKFIFFSSVKAVADVVTGDELTEDAVPAPVGPYGESKMAAESYILSRSGHRNWKKKRVYILRPCMIHGPGNKGNLNLLYRVVRRGMPWPLGAFDNRRSLAGIDNVCFVVDQILKRDIPPGIYHLCDDEALSTNEIVGLMCAMTGQKPRVWRLNRGLIRFCARVGTWLRLPFNTTRLRKLTESYVVSNRKIRQALGIKRMPVDARAGLRKTIRSLSPSKQHV